MLAREGIVSGETGAGGLGGLLELLEGRGRDAAAARLRLDEGASVLLISTEGATDPVSYREIVGARSVVSNRRATSSDKVPD